MRQSPSPFSTLPVYRIEYEAAAAVMSMDKIFMAHPESMLILYPALSQKCPQNIANKAVENVPTETILPISADQMPFDDRKKFRFRFQMPIPKPMISSDIRKNLTIFGSFIICLI